MDESIIEIIFFIQYVYVQIEIFYLLQIYLCSVSANDFFNFSFHSRLKLEAKYLNCFR